MHKTMVQYMNRVCYAKISALLMFWVRFQSRDEGCLKSASLPNPSLIFSMRLAYAFPAELKAAIQS